MAPDEPRIGTEPADTGDGAPGAPVTPPADAAPVHEQDATTVVTTEPDAASQTTELEAAPSPAERKNYAPPVPADPEARKPKKHRSTAARIIEIPMLVFLAFIIAVVIKTFLVQAFYIPSVSMVPTLRVGDRVLVEKVGYRFGDVSRGDVVVFEKEVFGAPSQDVPWYEDARNLLRELLGLPTGSEEDYIKRVVAIGGDVIRYTGSPRKLIVNGEIVEEDYVQGGRDAGSPALTSDDCERLRMEVSGKGCRVPAGSIFVMGDNRSNSEDSRVIGPVEESKVVGKAFVIIWPPGDIGTL